MKLKDIFSKCLPLALLICSMVLFSGCVGANIDSTQNSEVGVWIFGVLCLLIFVYGSVGCYFEHLFDDFLGRVDNNGFKPLWVYSPRPYTRVMLIVLLAVTALSLTLLIFQFVGFLVWLVAVVAKFIIIGVYYIGWILCVIAGLCAIVVVFGDWGSKVIAAVVGVLLGCLGYFIVDHKNDIYYAADATELWGVNFRNTLDVSGWVTNLLNEHWFTMVMVIAVPVAVFLGVAVLLLIVSWTLRIIENIAVRSYNLKHECPNCGNTNGFEYLASDTNELGVRLRRIARIHPIALHPGRYGLFTQRNPATGEKLPTMIFNGKADLPRYCPECGEYINVGTEEITGTSVHVAVAGVRSSGKSYLLYSALNHLKDMYGSDFRQIEIDNNKIEDMYARIAEGEGIQTAVKDLYKAVQVRFDVDGRPFPYHFYFYDVAGEKFDDSSESYKAGMRTYRNIKTVIFVIDPTTLDLDQLGVSGDLEKWQKKVNPNGEHYNVENAFSMLMNTLEAAGRVKKGKVDLHLMLVMTKKDLGYFEAGHLDDIIDNYNAKLAELEAGDKKVKKSDMPDDPMKQFIMERLGLHNLVGQAETTYKSVSYHAASAKDVGDLERIFIEALNKAGAKDIK